MRGRGILSFHSRFQISIQDDQRSRSFLHAVCTVDQALDNVKARWLRSRTFRYFLIPHRNHGGGQVESGRLIARHPISLRSALRCSVCRLDKNNADRGKRNKHQLPAPSSHHPPASLLCFMAKKKKKAWPLSRESGCTTDTDHPRRDEVE